jgi:GGDEF domain-containing protein
MAEPPFGARRPRPVADVPPPALADGQVVAKGWLLALLAERPLGQAGAIPVAELAGEGPGLCAAALRAVGSEAGLERLLSGDDLAAAARAGELAGAGGPKAIVAAVAALRGALWEALVATMAPLDQPTTAALADRLAYVCDAVAGACLSAAPPQGPPTFHVSDARRPHLVEVRNRWRQALRRGLDEHARRGTPLALLALEIDDAARLLASDPAALARAEGAVRDALEGGEVLDRDGDGRMWIVAGTGAGARTGAASARALAQRLADEVAAGGPVRGAALTVSIGVASCPPDAPDADALAALADERLFAARAAGVPIA